VCLQVFAHSSIHQCGSHLATSTVSPNAMSVGGIQPNHVHYRGPEASEIDSAGWSNGEKIGTLWNIESCAMDPSAFVLSMHLAQVKDR
jgi:hypothetical protein